jgi:hypothetical protein
LASSVVAAAAAAASPAAIRKMADDTVRASARAVDVAWLNSLVVSSSSDMDVLGGRAGGQAGRRQ